MLVSNIVFGRWKLARVSSLFGRRPITWAERERDSFLFLRCLYPPRRLLERSTMRLPREVPGEAHNVIYVVCVGPRFDVISFRFECLVKLVES